MQAAMTAPVRPLVKEPIWALGLMSGTSLDGVDAALIRTDGEIITDFGPALTVAYDGDLRERIRGVLGADRNENGEAWATAEDNKAVANMVLMRVFMITVLSG